MTTPSDRRAKAGLPEATRLEAHSSAWALERLAKVLADIANSTPREDHGGNCGLNLKTTRPLRKEESKGGNASETHM